MAIFVITLTAFYPLFNYNLSNPSRFPKAFELMRQWAWWLLLLAGIRVKRTGGDNLPSEPYIVCANHSSYVDIISMYRTLADYFVFMGKSEINNWPLFHIFFSKGMNISVDRTNPVGAHAALLRAKEELAKGHNVIIFPEGTIPGSAPKMKAFKNGAFKLSMETNAPIVPITFLNNCERLPTGPALKRPGGPGIAEAIIHPTVYPQDYLEAGVVQYKQDIFAIINKPLEEYYGD